MSEGTSVTRVVLGACGAVMAGWGAWLLLQTGLANVLATATWLIGGVIAHDALLAPLTIVVTAAALAVLPAAARAPAAAAAVVVGTATLVALPVLGRPGAEADNPSLLPRDYVLGWTAIAAVAVAIALVVVIVSAARSRRATRGPRQAGHDERSDD